MPKLIPILSFTTLVFNGFCGARIAAMVGTQPWWLIGVAIVGFLTCDVVLALVIDWLNKKWRR